MNLCERRTLASLSRRFAQNWKKFMKIYTRPRFQRRSIGAAARRDVAPFKELVYDLIIICVRRPYARWTLTRAAENDRADLSFKRELISDKASGGVWPYNKMIKVHGLLRNENNRDRDSDRWCNLYGLHYYYRWKVIFIPRYYRTAMLIAMPSATASAHPLFLRRD